MRRNATTLAAIICLTALAGCQANLNKHRNTGSPKTYGEPEKGISEDKGVTTALSKRNLKLNPYGDIVLANREHCNIELSGHRGYFRSPENSVPAIARGLAAGNDTVELDIYRLRSGAWVLHHDHKLGRSSENPRKNRTTDIERFNTREWGEVRLRDPETTLVRQDVPAPFINEAIKTLKASLKPGQKVNFEIKSKADVEQLAIMDAFINENINGQYYYSSPFVDVLKSIRVFNGSVYLGLVAKPHPGSIDILRATLSGKNQRLGALNNRETRAANRAADYLINKESKRTDWLTTASLNRLSKGDWGAFGIHADIRYFMNDSGLAGRIKARGFKLQTYTINDPNYHLDSLEVMASREGLPDGAVIDSPPYVACQRLAGSVRPAVVAKLNEPNDVALIKFLPADADFDDLVQQKHYFSEDLYLKNDGTLASLIAYGEKAQGHAAHHVDTNDHTGSTNRRGPSVIRDDEVAFDRPGAILIDVRME